MPDIGHPETARFAPVAEFDRRGPAAKARDLLRAQSEGVLSTLSLHKGGWPFASAAPYALSRRGQPIFLFSTLAQHTKNFRADPRACLFVQDPESRDDPRDAGRIAVLGRVIPVSASETADARARYLARHPRAETLFAAHDFNLYVHAIEEVRFIAGFGSMGWVSGPDVLLDPARDPLARHAGALCGQINENHAPALSLVCRALRGKSGDAAQMVAVDSFGFDVEIWKGARIERVRFDFPEPLCTPSAVREHLVELLRDARIRLGVAARDAGG